MTQVYYLLLKNMEMLNYVRITKEPRLRGHRLCRRSWSRQHAWLEGSFSGKIESRRNVFLERDSNRRWTTREATRLICGAMKQLLRNCAVAAPLEQKALG